MVLLVLLVLYGGWIVTRLRRVRVARDAAVIAANSRIKIIVSAQRVATIALGIGIVGLRLTGFSVLWKACQYLHI